MKSLVYVCFGVLRSRRKARENQFEDEFGRLDLDIWMLSTKHREYFSTNFYNTFFVLHVVGENK